MMNRLQKLVSRWLVLLTALTAPLPLLVLGFEWALVLLTGFLLVHAIIVSNYFGDRLAGKTAFYLISRVEPDSDETTFADVFMLGAAAFTVLAPVMAILERLQ